MGLLERIFGKKQETPREEKTYSIKTLETALHSAKKGLEADSKKTVFGKVAEIKHALSTIEKILVRIQRKEISTEEGNTKLRKVVKTTKRELVPKMRNMLSQLKPPQTDNPLDIRNYSFTAAKTLAQMPSFAKSLAYTGILFKEEMKEIGEQMRDLNRLISEISRGNSLARLSAAASAQEAIKAVSRSETELTSLRKAVESKKTLATGAKEKERRLAQDIGVLEGSAAAKELSSLKASLKEAEKKKDGLNSLLANTLSPIEKPARRLLKLHETRVWKIENKDAELLAKYLGNGISAVKADPKGESFKRSLSELSRALAEGKISLKDREKDKRLSSLKELMDGNLHADFFWKLNKIEAEINSVNKKLSESTLNADIRKAEEALSRQESETPALKKNLEKLKTELAEKEDALSNTRAKLEELSSLALGEKVSVSL